MSLQTQIGHVGEMRTTKTKARFGCLLRPAAWIWNGPILKKQISKTVNKISNEHSISNRQRSRGIN